MKQWKGQSDDLTSVGSPGRHPFLSSDGSFMDGTIRQEKLSFLWCGGLQCLVNYSKQPSMPKMIELYFGWL